MLTLQIPTLLALLATALMAVVIFAPERVAARPTISFAPPLAPAHIEPAPHTRSHLERWEPESDSLLDAATAAVPLDAATATVAQPPAWPALVDPRATGCDVRVRLALVDALLTVGTPWSRAILQRALDDESDPDVRSAVIAAGVCDLGAAGVTEPARASFPG
jgi:hypothetical protein